MQRVAMSWLVYHLTSSEFLLVALFGERVCFLLNGISYLAVLAALLRMKIPPPGSEKNTASEAAERSAGRIFLFIRFCADIECHTTLHLNPFASNTPHDKITLKLHKPFYLFIQGRNKRVGMPDDAGCLILDTGF
jgi:hypothetical protein